MSILGLRRRAAGLARPRLDGVDHRVTEVARAAVVGPEDQLLDAGGLQFEVVGLHVAAAADRLLAHRAQRVADVVEGRRGPLGLRDALAVRLQPRAVERDPADRMVPEQRILAGMAAALHEAAAGKPDRLA